MSVIVSCARGHNASTTLMVDGKIVFYLEEERITRRKYDGGPLMGLLKVFDYVDHIDHLVVCHTHKSGPELDWTGESVYEGIIRKMLRTTGGTFDHPLKPVKPKPYEYHECSNIHHQMHATCAFMNSGFDTAACLVVDGAGSFLQTDISKHETCFEFESIFKVSHPSKIEPVYKHIGTSYPLGVKSLRGLLVDEEKPEDVDEACDTILTEYPGITKCYESATRYAGFKTIDAGKLMGLSPYGQPNPDLPPFFRDGWGNRDVFIPDYPNGSYMNTQRYKIFMDDEEEMRRTGQFDEGWGFIGENYTQTQKDVAYQIQRESEQEMIKLIRKAHEMTGEKNICISGGFGLNCVANYKYWEEFPDLNIYCEPISHDGGTSIGGAYHVLNQLQPSRNLGERKSIYYGPQYDPQTYTQYFEEDFLEVTDTSYDDIAKLIRSGEIVTIFQGRSEGGPRALGNRSILFDPTIKDGKDIVNRVKKREFFRPFACSMKKEKVHDWFDLKGREASPHMMYAVECKPGVEEKIPSVIHVDGTCRIQTLGEDDNEHYYKLIDAFEKLSGVPILFNTSFNLGGDPLVETIEDAINTLLKSKIEYMYLPELQKLVKVPNDAE
tara:strand:+ start:10669 stop:12489 length:1821 start_codon:yes stop_codon:yes gene_type:complete